MQMIDAKAYLQRVKLYDTSIESKLREIEHLKEMTTKITATLKQDAAFGSGGSQDKIGDAIAKIVDLQNEINRAVDEFVDLKRNVESMIGQIQNADHAAILRKRYFEYKTWETIACEMHYSYRNVCYIHGRALQEMSAIIGRKRETAK